jgi:hypothetical protein
MERQWICGKLIIVELTLIFSSSFNYFEVAVLNIFSL